MAGAEIASAAMRLASSAAQPLGAQASGARGARPDRAAPLAAIPDLALCPPEPALLAALPPGLLFRYEAVPLRREGEGVLFAGVRPAALPALAAAAERAGLGAAGAHGFVPVTAAEIAEVLDGIAPAQASAALTRTAPEDSCRSLKRSAAALLLLMLASALVVAPLAAVLALIGAAALSLAASSALRLVAAVATIPPAPRPAAPILLHLPVISVLVPLYREDCVTSRLLQRLEAVEYPRGKLDLRLVVEADDPVTARALARCELPHWITVVRVPPGPVRTKPRALNYALDGCRGSIIGIWDAEDAPAPDQLRKVADAFAAAPADVGCVQGRLALDARGGGPIARCFSLEYDAWFAVILPGLARLRLPVPLGGTTLFLRREAVEAVGAWDAFNVTEDADLGVRLHRRGWRTVLIDTATVEEPTRRPGPWVRQRSRWLKGYAATWAVHSRRPRALVRDLGWRGALGFQVLVGGTLVQFALAPLFWLFWPAALGLPGPLDGAVPTWAQHALLALFILSELTALGVYALAAWRVRAPLKAAFWPVMIPYFLLATLAAWKALVELAVAPFYWDKTDHG